jgi:hypothetical protein
VSAKKPPRKRVETLDDALRMFTRVQMRLLNEGIGIEISLRSFPVKSQKPKQEVKP